MITFPYRILSVDPATGRSGWSVLDIVSLNPLKIQIIASGQLEGDKLLKTKREMNKIFNKQFCVLDALYETYIELIETYKPHQIVSEGAFGYVHMNALISLTLAINVLRRASRTILGKDIVEVAPTVSKRAFTGTGSADKDRMRLAYQTNDYLLGVVADDKISEHEIDSIAHGCGYIRRDILKNLYPTKVELKKQKKKLS